MKIIGISGRMKAGKTTVARHLLSIISSTTSPITYISTNGFFSYPKKVFADLFGYSGVDMDSQEFKDDVHYCGKTNRVLMQEFGRKMREIWLDIWVEHWKEGVLDLTQDDQLVIVPDVRFPNEVKAIQDMGGIVIRLTRNPVNSNDETETALDEMAIHSGLSWMPYGKPDKFDRTVDNAIMSIDETNEICLKIAKEYINAKN